MPLILPFNPVWRSYRGGSLLRRFRGLADTPDDHFPEDWLASSVSARNGENAQGPREGISRVVWNSREIEFPDLVHTAPEFFPGSRSGSGSGTLGMLVKLLDSADRLHIQAHPDDAFVQAHLGGERGKTECWYILSTRGEGVVYLGFKNPVSRDDWREIIAAQDLARMRSLFNVIPVSPGDCFIVPAGVPHAIGAGVFMVELQQPSDWVVRCEYTIGDHTLPEESRFMGLPLEQILGIFDYTAHSPGDFKQTPVAVRTTGGLVVEEIIEARYRRFFRMNRFRGGGADAAAIETIEPTLIIVTQGSGVIRSPAGDTPCVRGSVLLLPRFEETLTWAPTTESWELLAVQPPA